MEMKLNVYNHEFPPKIFDVCRNMWIARFTNFVTDMGTICNYGLSLAMILLDIFGIRFVLLDIDCQRVRVFKYSGVWYNERWYKEHVLQWRVFFNKIKMLQRVRKNTIGRRTKRMRMPFSGFFCFDLSFSYYVCFIFF